MSNSDLSKFSSALSPSNFSTDHLSPVAKQQIHSDASLVVRETVYRNLRENAFAMVQTTAMRNVADLSLLSDQLSANCPNAEKRLAFLVDNYTWRCNQRLSR